jgi:hypothetical protein
MKLPPPFPKRAALAALAALAASVVALALLAGCKKKPAPAPPPPPKPAATNAVAGAGTNLVTEFVSVFDDSPPPGNKGRDPFNPDSKSRYPVPSAAVTPSASPAGPSDPQLKLFGVAGSPGRWLVTINNQFFLLNEEANVKVPGGVVKLKVVGIGSNYADVVVEGTAGSRHLTIDQKK